MENLRRREEKEKEEDEEEDEEVGLTVGWWCREGCDAPSGSVSCRRKS